MVGLVSGVKLLPAEGVRNGRQQAQQAEALSRCRTFFSGLNSTTFRHHDQKGEARVY